MAVFNEDLTNTENQKFNKMLSYMNGSFWVVYVLIFCKGVGGIMDASSEISGENLRNDNQNSSAPDVKIELITDVVLNGLPHLVWWTRQNKLVWLTVAAAVLVFALMTVLYLVNNALTDMTRHTKKIYVFMIQVERTAGNRRNLNSIKYFTLRAVTFLSVLLLCLGGFTVGPPLAILIFMAMGQCGVIIGKWLVLYGGQIYRDEDSPDLKEGSPDSKEGSHDSKEGSPGSKKGSPGSKEGSPDSKIESTGPRRPSMGTVEQTIGLLQTELLQQQVTKRKLKKEC